MGLKVGQLPEDVVISVISDIPGDLGCIDLVHVWSSRQGLVTRFTGSPSCCLAYLAMNQTMEYNKNCPYLSSKMSGRYPLWWSLCFSWREINEFDISCIQVCLHFQQAQKHNSTRKVPRSPKSPKSSRSPTEEETERSSILQEFLDDHALLVRHGQGLSVAHAELNTLV